MTVITYGTFDLFHIGHLRLLERAKELAGKDGKLIVAVLTDWFNWVEKHKRCMICDKDRMEIVGVLKYTAGRRNAVRNRGAIRANYRASRTISRRGCFGTRRCVYRNVEEYLALKGFREK